MGNDHVLKVHCSKRTSQKALLLSEGPRGEGHPGSACRELGYSKSGGCRWFWALCFTGSRLQGLEDKLKSWTGGYTGRVPGEGGCNVEKCWAWTHVPATAQRQLSRNLGAEAAAPCINESHKQSPNCFLFSFLPLFLIPTFNTLATKSFFIL